MIRKLKSGLVVAALMTGAVIYIPTACRIAQSYQELKVTGGSLSTVERLMLSVVLAQRG